MSRCCFCTNKVLIILRYLTQLIIIYLQNHVDEADVKEKLQDELNKANESNLATPIINSDDRDTQKMTSPHPHPLPPINIHKNGKINDTFHDVDSIENFDESDKKLTTLNLDDYPTDSRSVSPTPSRKGKKKKNKKKNKNRDSILADEVDGSAKDKEEDKTVKCLYVALMCCECSIS